MIITEIKESIINDIMISEKCDEIDTFIKQNKSLHKTVEVCRKKE